MPPALGLFEIFFAVDIGSILQWVKRNSNSTLCISREPIFNHAWAQSEVGVQKIDKKSHHEDTKIHKNVVYLRVFVSLW
ncbi:MAG: hypothetical protein DMG08_14120 [Acidobacteria bacterium]|nr:MAG: hypothetical protein DMG08_14120 [Acidobacteriota bacterium]